MAGAPKLPPGFTWDEPTGLGSDASGRRYAVVPVPERVEKYREYFGLQPKNPQIEAPTKPTKKTSGNRSGLAIALSGMQRLMDDPDLRLTPHQAAGVMGNLAHESGWFKQMQEIKPTVPGSRGGFGWAQWTGPRRKAFEQWTRQNKLDPYSDEANFGFLKHELLTSERPALEKLRKAKDPYQATQFFMGKVGDVTGFERPGIPHFGSRKVRAEKILSAYQSGKPAGSDTQMASAAPQLPPGFTWD